MILSKTSKPIGGGWEPITNQLPSMPLKFSPALYIKMISYPYLDITIMMESPLAVVDVVKQRMMDTYQEMFTMLNTTILGSAGSNNLQMLGLQDIIDNGTNQSTYGGLSRSTYPALNSQIYNMSSYTSLPTYQVIHLALNSFLNDVNQKLPDVGITSFAVFNALTTSMTNIERVNIEDPKDILTSRDWSVQAVSVDGVPILPDPNITTNSIMFLNLDKLHFGFIPQLCFQATEPESMLPVGQLGYVQAAMIAGQFYSFEPSAHFMAINIPVSQALL
jgi:hypothetical protein